MTNQNIFLGKPMRNDDVYVTNKIVSMEDMVKMPTRKGLEQGIIANGKLVNVVSNSYGHLPNQQFFGEVERGLIESGIGYATRSINRDDRSFAVDYILRDESAIVSIKKGMDKIVPMLRFVNSYDGSSKTSGIFGLYRQICTNGLMGFVKTDIGFSIKHRGNVVEFVLPHIEQMVKVFMESEFHQIRRRFEVLAERPIANVNDFVKLTSEQLKVFKYESSEKNPEPSLNARMVIDTIHSEAGQLGTMPNMWLGYNAFNSLIHDKLKKTFDAQASLDARLLEIVESM